MSLKTRPFFRKTVSKADPWKNRFRATQDKKLEFTEKHLFVRKQSKKCTGRFGTRKSNSLKNPFFWTNTLKNTKFAPNPFFGQFSAALVRDFGHFVREFALLCGKLCGNMPFCADFLKNLAMANFLLFW